MVNMYNNALKTGFLPLSVSQASISLISKNDKDPLNCGNYKPISLCSVDAKILAKILAQWLEPFLPELIHSDQTGFIKNVKSFLILGRF